MKSIDVPQVRSDLFVERGTPGYLRSDNGPEFTAALISEWLDRVDVDTLFIEPGSPWENGYVESFNKAARCASRKATSTIPIPPRSDTQPLHRNLTPA